MDVGQNGNAPSIGDGLSPGDPWHWPGWSVGQNDEPEILQQSNEDLRIGSAPSSESPFSDAAQRHSTASDSLSGKVRSARRSNVAPNSARGSSSGRGAAGQAAVLAATSAGRHHRRGTSGSGNRSATPRSGRPLGAVEAKRSGGNG